MDSPYYGKVLVKCRQNVANKLFITRVFNPVRPHTWLKELTLSVRYMQNLHTILLKWMLLQLEVLVVWHEFQVRPGFDSSAPVLN